MKRIRSIVFSVFYYFFREDARSALWSEECDEMGRYYEDHPEEIPA